MSLLDILSGAESGGYKERMAGQAELEGLRNRSLFETMTEDRLQRRVKDIYGTQGRPETILPIDQAGPQVQGEGMGAVSPFQQELARAQLAAASPQAFAPAYTASVRPPTAPAGLKPGTLQKVGRKTPQGPEEVSTRYLGGPVGDASSWQEVGARAYVQPYQGKGAGLREQADFDYYQGLHGEADSLADSARNYEYINQTLEGVETGMFDEAILASQKFARRLGADSFDSSIAAREAASSAFSQATVDLMKPDSESGKRALAGQSSDKELEFFKGIPPGMGKTESGRKLISLVARERARRADEIAVMAFDAEDRGVQAKRFRKMVRDRFKNVDVPPEWTALLGRAEAEAKAKGPQDTPQMKATVVSDLPPGFILQADGTAINTETGQIARPQ